MDTGNIAVILSLGVVAPTWIVFHYLSRWRATKTITGEDEKDYFVHFSAVPEDVRLNEGDKVTFDVVETEKGEQAQNIQLA